MKKQISSTQKKRKEISLNKNSKKLKKIKSENTKEIDTLFIQKESNIQSYKMNKSRNNIKLNSSGKKLSIKMKSTRKSFFNSFSIIAESS